MSCDFERVFHSAWAVRGHFSRSAFPCLRLSVLDEATADFILILLERVVPTATSALALIVYISFHQKSILTIRITSSSRENTVRPRGRSGTAVAAASRPMSSRPKGTARISYTAA